MIKQTKVFKGLRYRNATTVAVAGLIFAVCFSCVGLNPQDSKRARVDKKTNTQLTVQVTASRSLVKLPPRTVDLASLNCELTEDEVRLYANATSPRQAEINFTWQVPVGRLIGKDRQVTWDLRGVAEGTYTATVTASDRHKHSASGSITIEVVICPGWHPPPPPCPTVSVSCPTRVESKGSVTFDVTVSGGHPEIKPTYEWSLSAGKIIGGEATRKITVDVSGLSQDSVTATVSVGGSDPSCPTVVSCTIQLTKLQWPDSLLTDSSSSPPVQNLHLFASSTSIFGSFNIRRIQQRVGRFRVANDGMFVLTERSYY